VSDVRLWVVVIEWWGPSPDPDDPCGDDCCHEGDWGTLEAVVDAPDAHQATTAALTAHATELEGLEHEPTLVRPATPSEHVRYRQVQTIDVPEGML
jgi:hypothetical protein